MKKTLVALLLLASLGAGLPAFAAEPSLHEVYQAAGAGKLDEAQRMMQTVLQAHPNSGKAHYVEAELLVKQGQLKQAASELAAAEKLAPGLPFANPRAVVSLRENIAHRPVEAQPQVQHAAVGMPVVRESTPPWGMLFMGLGLIAFIAWAVRFMGRRNGSNVGTSSTGFGGYRPPYPAAPNGGAPAYGMPGSAPAYGMPGAGPVAGSGLGSQVLGGLATGAAVGAGVVAGEALMHHFMDGRSAAPSMNEPAFSSFDSIPDLPSTPLNDMGGNDFGIADNSSWDDGGAGGDSDWG